MRYRTRILIAAAVVLVSGIAHGVWVNRWQTSTDLEAAALRLERVPMTVGTWQGEDRALDQRRFEQAQLAGSLIRTYREQTTGRRVSIVLLCGQPGPIAVHTPVICLQGSGYQMLAEPSPFASAGEGAAASEFVLGKFARPNATVPSETCVLWSWNATGTWTTPSQPRLTFARNRALYKLYVIFEMPPGNSRLEDDPRTEFLRQLLPALHKALFEDV